jgi:hypothetical protein
LPALVLGLAPDEQATKAPASANAAATRAPREKRKLPTAEPLDRLVTV